MIFKLFSAHLFFYFAKS